jgi:hypothetical protein
MRLLDFLRSARPTHAVFGTYVFDPWFYEAYVLRHLRAQGCTSQFLLIDHDCLVGTLEAGGLPPTLMGTHYLAQGICAPEAFHPKFLLLLTRESGELLLGSNNLTVPGYTHNDELLVHLHYQPDDTVYLAIFQQCWRYIQRCLALQRSSEVVLNHCQQIGEECPWLLADSAPPADTWLLGWPGGDGSIADQLAGILSKEVIRHVTIMAPYFDAKLAALTRLAKTFSHADVRVLVQPARCTVNPGRVPSLPKNVRFFDLSDVGRGEDGARFFHAKSILLESRKNSYCLMGSANISVAALYAPPDHGNAELCLLSRHNDPEHFRSVLGINGTLDDLTPIDMTAVKTAYSAPATVPPGDPPPLQPTAAEQDGKMVRVFCGLESAAITWETLQLRVHQTAVPLSQRTAGELRFAAPETSTGDASTIGRLTCRWKGKDWSSTPFVIHNIVVLQRYVQAGRFGKLAGYMRRGSFLSGDLSAVASLMAEMLSGFPPAQAKPAEPARPTAKTASAQSLEPSAEPVRVPYEQFLTGSEHQKTWVAKAGYATHSDLDAYLRLVASSIERSAGGESEPAAEPLLDEQEEDENDDQPKIRTEEERPAASVRASEVTQFQKRFLSLLQRYREELNQSNLQKEPLSLRDMGKLIVIGQTTLFFCCKDLPGDFQSPSGKKRRYLELEQVRESLQDILHCWFLSNRGRLIDRVMIEPGEHFYRTAEIEFFLVTVGLLAAALRRVSNTSFDRLLAAATHWRSCVHSARLQEGEITLRAQRVIENLGLEPIMHADRWQATWREAAGLGRTLAAAQKTLRDFGDGAAWLGFNKTHAAGSPQIGDILWNPAVGFTSVAELRVGGKIWLSTDWNEQSKGYAAGNFANLSAIARGGPSPNAAIRQVCQSVIAAIGK